MIANAVRLADRGPRRPDADGSLSVPVLKAALEVGRQDRLWLKQKLTDRKSESDALREELQVLNRALPDPTQSDGAPAEPTVPAMTLATQLRRRLKGLWEEREHLVAVLQEAAREREQMTLAVQRATLEAQAATRRASQAVLAADAAARERDALAAELASRRAVPVEAAARTQPSGPDDAPGLPTRADVDEIARALEMMAAALGDLRQRIEPLTSSGQASAVAEGGCPCRAGAVGTAG